MNSEMNLFNPLDLELSRSTFHMTPTRSTTFNAGRLIPTFSMDIIPGDSIKMGCDTLIKMSTPVYPTMDMLYCDVFFFYVSYDLLLGRRYGSPSINDGNQSWKAIIGAQDNLLNLPVPARGLQIPGLSMSVDETVPVAGSLSDYLYLEFDTNQPNCLTVLTYFAIWNENFAEPNTQTRVTWSFDENNDLVPYGVVPIVGTAAEIKATRDVTITGDYKRVNALGADDGASTTATAKADYWLPFPVSVFHGYFGSALPWPQRNLEGVALPLGEMAPVVTGEASHMKVGDKVWPILNLLGASVDSAGKYTIAGAPASSSAPANSGADSHLGTHGIDTSNGTVSWQFSNLYADLSQATAANVNALRTAIQQQRWFEKLARSGNRYDELKYGLFGVRAMDAGKDRPLYLGGKRIPLNIEMVASTNGDTAEGASSGAGSLGQLGGFSHTNDSDHYFYHSFDDWGTLMCVVCVRPHQTFSAGMDFKDLRRTREDFYFPTFAHLGEQLLKSNLISHTSIYFGYQQAWEELRQIPDRVSGLLKSGRSLGFMTYADDFETVNLAGFLDGSRYVKNVDATLKVSSNSAGFQFIIQQTFDIVARRPLPTYSIPGLMDHF